jgi:hypothetical protein
MGGEEDAAKWAEFRPDIIGSVSVDPEDSA